MMKEFAMSRQLLTAVALLLCIACDFHATTAEPPYPPGGNRPPVAHIQGPASAWEGELVLFSSTGSSAPDGGHLTFIWDFGNGVRLSSDNHPSPNEVWSTTYADDGLYTVTLTVRNSSGATATAIQKVTVKNAPPVIDCLCPPDQQAIGIPGVTLVKFGDPGSRDIHSLVIRWGDGTTDSLAPESDSLGFDGIQWSSHRVPHEFKQAGTYIIHATVRDNGGGVDSGVAGPVLVFDAAERTSVAGYDVFDIGTLGGNSAIPADLNDNDQIVGSSLTASRAEHAFLWENGAITDLGTLGHEGSVAQRINNAGVIAGVVWKGNLSLGYGPRTIPAIWRGSSGTLLDSTDTGVGYQAVAINALGDVVWNHHSQDTVSAWRLRDDSWQALGSMYPKVPTVSTASAMNDHGQIIGTSPVRPSPPGTFVGDLVVHAFLWQDGTMQDLGTLGSSPCFSDSTKDCATSFALAVNQIGAVVGTSNYQFFLWKNGTLRSIRPISHPYFGQPPNRAFINNRGQIAVSTDGGAYFWEDGVWRSIGTLGGLTSVAGLNDDGTVIGTSMTRSGEQHVFAWAEQRGMIDLGAGPHGFTAAWASDINARGDIIGFAAPRCHGDNHTCLYPTEARAILWRNTQASANR